MISLRERSGLSPILIIILIVVIVLVLIVYVSTSFYEVFGTPDYDSCWVDITDKVGKHFDVTHNLGSEDLLVDISGRTALPTVYPGPGAHQKYLGLDTKNGWIKTYEAPYGDHASGYDVVQTSDGGYAIAGQTTQWDEGGSDVYLVKTDSWGNTRWSRTYGESGATDEKGYSLVRTSDGGYAITGSSGGDVYLLKTNSEGVKQWSHTYGGAEIDIGYDVVQTSDGGYAITGETWSFGGERAEVYLVKTNSEGVFQWHATYGGTEYHDIGYSLVQTPSDGGYAIAGRISSDVYLVKTGPTGEVIWGRAYGGTGDDVGFSLVQTSDGGYAIVGQTTSDDTDVYLVKTNSYGLMQWDATYAGEDIEGADIDVGRSVVQTSDGGYAITGVANLDINQYESDIYLVKTDSEGNEQWSKTWGRNGEEWGHSLVRTSDGGYAIAATWSGAGIYHEIHLVKTDVEVGLARTDTSANTITLYRGETDPYWNYVKVRIWKTD